MQAKTLCLQPQAFPSSSHLLLDTLDFSTQPLDQPVELGDLIFGAFQVISMSACCVLQFTQLDRKDRCHAFRKSTKVYQSQVQSLQAFDRKAETQLGQ